MTYQLYRVEALSRPPTSPALGEFADFDAALAARDADLLVQLHDHPAPPREIAHLIVGPGVAGARTEHPVVTFAGVDPDERNPAVALEETRLWLKRIRRR